MSSLHKAHNTLSNFFFIFLILNTVGMKCVKLESQNCCTKIYFHMNFITATTKYY